MIEYVVIGERALAIGTPESTVYARQEIAESGGLWAYVWEAPQATLEDAIAAGFEGARRTKRTLYGR